MYLTKKFKTQVSFPDKAHPTSSDKNHVSAIYITVKKLYFINVFIIPYFEYQL